MVKPCARKVRIVYSLNNVQGVLVTQKKRNIPSLRLFILFCIGLFFGQSILGKPVGILDDGHDDKPSHAYLGR